MHAWIYQISDAPIKETINEDTLYQGDGTDYDYCAEITEEGRKSAIEALKDYILPSGIFCQIDDTTFEYQGGIDEWKAQWVERIQDLASQLNVEYVLKFVGHSYKLERALKNRPDLCRRVGGADALDRRFGGRQ